jgi:hypothetical protein
MDPAEARGGGRTARNAANDENSASVAVRGGRMVQWAMKVG